jgi:transcriptional regulator with XRE-family HTH domain
MPSTPSERLTAARERAGLEIGDVADRAGLPFAHYRDLEMFDDDVWNTVSLAELQKLGRIVGVRPLAILEGEGAPLPARRMTFTEFSAAVGAAVRASGSSVDAWGEEAGWDVAPLLEDPEQVWSLNADGLRDIADAAGVDWRSVLPD